jgi:hypothetical protein
MSMSPPTPKKIDTNLSWQNLSDTQFFHKVNRFKQIRL